jgi:hypothetical protein
MAGADDASQAIAKQVAATPFVDTHKHLLEGSRRFKAASDPENTAVLVSDIRLLYSHYADSDLIVARPQTDDLGTGLYDPIHRPHVAGTAD